MADYDLVVVGGGAAGLGAVRAEVRAGARVLLVSDGEPGGDCAFTACVPSKTFIEAAARGLPFAQATRRVRDAVAAVATENTATLRAEGIDVTLGRARFTAPGRVQVDGRPVTASRVVVATGAGPLIPPIPGLVVMPPVRPVGLGTGSVPGCPGVIVVAVGPGCGRRVGCVVGRGRL